MATVSKGRTFVSGETVTPAKLNELVDNATVPPIVDADVSASAAIALSKLATGALPTGITVASANIVDGTIVAADIASGAVTAPKLQNGVTLQTVYAQTTAQTTIGDVAGDAIPFDNTKPQNTEGEEILTASITPSSATSKILIQAGITGTVGGSAATITIALFKDSGANALACAFDSRPANYAITFPFAHQDSPATTSSVTYKIRVGYVATGGGLFLNAGVNGALRYDGTLTSWMTLTEIKA